MIRKKKPSAHGRVLLAPVGEEDDKVDVGGVLNTNSLSVYAKFKEKQVRFLTVEFMITILRFLAIDLGIRGGYGSLVPRVNGL